MTSPPPPRTRERQVMWAVVGGLVLGLLVILGAVAVLVVVSNDDAPPRRSTDVPTEPLPRGESTDVADPALPADEANILDLRTGDCFDVEDGKGDLVGGVKRVSCDQPHTFQVTGVVEIAGTTYPDQRTIRREAHACLTRFNTFLGIAYRDSVYDASYFRPTRESWQQDEDRSLTCLALHPREKKLTRSLEGIAR